MFQFASGLGIAKENGMSFCMSPGGAMHEIADAFVGPFPPKCTVPYLHRFKEKGYATFQHFDLSAKEERGKNYQNVAIGSYLQSWRYFEIVKDDVRQRLQFKHALRLRANAYLSTHSGEESEAPSYRVGIHVRRGDHLKLGYLKFPSIEYFRNAADYFRGLHEHVVFVIASDDPSWCIDQPFFRGKSFHVITESHSALLDMAILASCDAVVTTVGTFGWWAGWLAGGPVVYYDGQFVLDHPINDDDKVDVTDYFPSVWIAMGDENTLQIRPSPVIDRSQPPRSNMSGIDVTMRRKWRPAEIFYINLDRHVRQRNFMDDHFNRMGLAFTRFSGFDASRWTGDESQWKDVLRQDIKQKIGEGRPRIASKIFAFVEDVYPIAVASDQLGRLGCAVSHIALWLSLSTKPRGEYIVLEDDVKISPANGLEMISRIFAGQRQKGRVEDDSYSSPLPSDWSVLYLIVVGHFARASVGSIGVDDLWYGDRLNEFVGQLKPPPQPATIGDSTRHNLGTLGFVFSGGAPMERLADVVIGILRQKARSTGNLNIDGAMVAASLIINMYILLPRTSVASNGSGDVIVQWSVGSREAELGHPLCLGLAFRDAPECADGGKKSRV
eukprot:g2625.t1